MRTTGILMVVWCAVLMAPGGVAGAKGRPVTDARAATNMNHCAPLGGNGIATGAEAAPSACFEVLPGEARVETSIADATRRPVLAWWGRYNADGGLGPYGWFCSAEEANLLVPEGAAVLEVTVYTAFPFCGPGVGTTGTVTATFFVY